MNDILEADAQKKRLKISEDNAKSFLTKNPGSTIRNDRGTFMAGIIATYQRCPACGARFPSSKGLTPIECPTCRTQPTKFFIAIKWQGNKERLYHDRMGKTIHSFAHAISVLGEIRTEIDPSRGSFDPKLYKKQSDTSFTAFWKTFLDSYEGKVGTYDKLKAIGAHLSFFEKFQMRDIRVLHIDQWWKTLKHLSPHYQNDVLGWIKKLFTEAKAQEIIERIPPRFPTPHSLPEPDVDEWLTEEQQEVILEEISKFDKAIYDFLFLTGVRVNEAVGLQKTDVKPEVIIIQHTVKRDGSLGITKNKKKRVIPRVPEINDCLERATKSLTEYVFVNKWGRRYSDDYLSDTLAAACIEAGIKPVRLKNATRHSFGMNLLGRGVDMYRVSKTMGHSDLRMTEHYAKILAREFEGMYGRKGDKAQGDKRGTKGKVVSGKFPKNK